MSRAFVAVAVGGAALFGTAPAQAQDEATVSVLHGVPDLTVDVYANGEKLLSDFKPGTLTDPLQLPADTYNIEIFEAGADPAGEPAIQKTVEVPAGANATVVAHLSEDGDPTLSPFVNDTSRVPAGQARLTVRHVAAAPAVDVLADGAPVFEGLTNPNEAKAEVPAGTVDAAVALAGETDPVIGPETLDLAEGSNTIVYAWGSAEDGNLALAVQTITGLETAPDGVPGGTGGLADPGMPTWLLLVMAAAVLGAGYGVRRVVTARARR